MFLTNHIELQEIDQSNPENDPTFKIYAHIENSFEIIKEIHINSGHGGRDRILTITNAKYANITHDMVKIFLQLCESCVLKQYSKNVGIVTNPIINTAFNEHVQADLVDMQAQQCEDFRFFLVYQDHFTKLVQIRPLKRKTAKATTSAMCDIFFTFGPPKTLQTDNGREFKNSLLERICKALGIHMVHGKPRNSQCNGGVERANQDIEKMLVTWKSNNLDLPWIAGLQFVQMFKNSALCAPIKMSPFEATFGYQMVQGIKDSIIPKALFDSTKTEEDLKTLEVLPENDIVSI